MHHIFLFERVAVVVGPWWEAGESGEILERGTRVELRRRPPEPQRGTESAAQRIVIDEPLFRADLFDRCDRPPGNLAAAHFHAGFDGVEPRDRQWPAQLRTDPLGWLRDQLADLDALLARSGVDVGDARDDAEALRAAALAIKDAVEQAWAVVRV